MRGLIFGPITAGILLYLLTAASFPATGSPYQLPLSAKKRALFVHLLKWLLALSVICLVNGWLNRWAENNWNWRKNKAAWQWENEVAVVTGGSNGIGKAVVKGLVSYGIRVAILDVEPLSEELLQNAEANKVTFYRCDITSRTAVHEAAEAIRSEVGSPSILINNAGIGNANTILEATPVSLRNIFEVNLISQWYTVQEFLPGMVANQKGHIMSVASMAAFLGLAGMVDYSCTKVGLLAFHEGLTQELKHRYNCPQIKTTIIYPNWTRTRLITAIDKGLKSLKAPVLDPQTVADVMIKQILQGRSGQIILGSSIAGSIRAFPTWLQEGIRDQLAKAVTVKASTAVVHRQDKENTDL